MRWESFLVLSVQRQRQGKEDNRVNESKIILTGLAAASVFGLIIKIRVQNGKEDILFYSIYLDILLDIG